MLCWLQSMIGHDSSHGKNADSIALLALAALSTSYNLPVYLHYNGTFRRAYLRMLRCQSDPVCDVQSVSSNRKVTVAVIPRDRAVVERAASHERSSQRQMALGRGPDACSKETEPPTSRASGTAWTLSNTKQLDASYAQRY